MYSWGKGYAFNPVGYVNPFKDPENPELAQAGLLSINFEKIKSFDSPLQTYAFTAIVIPPQENINDKYGELKNTGIAIKNYFLLWDIDFDLMGYYSEINPKKMGFDFAANVKENMELHGEISYIKDKIKYKIVDDEIFSELLTHYPHDDHSDLTSPRFKIHRQNGAYLWAESREGVIYGEERVVLRQKVNIEQRTSDDQTTSHIKSREIEIERATNKITSRQQVTIIGDNYTIVAGAMELFSDEKRLYLSKGVEGHYEP